MIQQGKFNKRTFKGFSKQSCARRLYLYLGNGREGWTYSDGTPVALEDKVHAQAHTVVVFGKIFEDEYLHALNMHGSEHIIDCTPTYIENEVWPSQSERAQKEQADWTRIIEAAERHQFVFAFELMWEPEPSFIEHMVGSIYASELERSRGDRPDVLLFEEHVGAGLFFSLDDENQIQMEERVHHGFAITVLDIKNTPRENCERHFSDVIYYIISLLYRIRALGYSERIAIRGTGNGILGRMEREQIREMTPKILRDMIRQEKVQDSSGRILDGHIVVDWELYKNQCTTFHQGLSMVMKDRSRFEDVRPTISKECQYCPFSHHCLHGDLRTRNRVESVPSGKDSLAVLPAMKPQVLLSLQSKNIHTINDLVEKAKDVYSENLSKSVCDEYAPYLRRYYFQALSIQKGMVVDQSDASYQEIFAPGAFTTELPKKRIPFVFLDIEGDPAQKRLVSLCYSFEGHTSVFVNRSIEAADECRLLRDFATSIQKNIRSLLHVGILFWGGIQKRNLSEALARHPHLEEEMPELFRMFAHKQSFSEPNIQNQMYDLERAVDTLFAFPLRFALTWHEVHTFLCATDMDVEQVCWGDGKNFLDFSIWNLYAGEPTGSRSKFSFSFQPEKEVLNPQLVHVFAQRNIRQKEKTGWIGDDGILALIEEELQKKMKALLDITEECYRRGKDFMYATPLHTDKNSCFAAPKSPKDSSRLTELLWDYEMMDRWVGFCSFRNKIAYPHDSIMKQSVMWVIPPKGVEREFCMPRVLQDSLSLLEVFGKELHVIPKSSYRVESIRSIPIRKTKTGLIPVHGKDIAAEGLVFERFTDLWNEKFLALVPNLLDKSELSYNLPLTEDEPWGTQPYTKQPSTAELYFCGAAQLREQGKLAHLPELKTNRHPAPSNDQKEAIQTFLQYPIALIQGPPGTGKSSTIIAMLDEWFAHRPSGKTARVLITAANYAAMTVVAQKICEDKSLSHIPLRLMNFERKSNIEGLKRHGVFVYYSYRSGWGAKRWKGSYFAGVREDAIPERCIFFANDYALGKLFAKNVKLPFFDLMVVDEASQLSPDHFLAALAYARPLQTTTKGADFVVTTPKEDWTKLLVVGDGDQLSAVRKVEIPKRYRPILQSLFSFYDYQLRRAGQTTIQLAQNFRSVSSIIRSINELGIYRTDLLAYDKLASCPRWIGETKLYAEEHSFSVGFLVHRSRTDVHRSPVEIDLTIHAVLRLWDATTVSMEEFFTKHVGIVTPHNAQRIALGEKLEDALSSYMSTNEKQQQKERFSLRGSIRTVDKFQGSDRSVIISTIGVSSPTRLKEEEDFLYQLNRCNVTISRPKYRLLFICAHTFLLHIPKEESNIKMIKGLNAIRTKICTRESIVKLNGHTSTLYYSTK